MALLDRHCFSTERNGSFNEANVVSARKSDVANLPEARGIVIRFFTLVIAIGLIAYPAFLIYAMTVPVEQFRTGGYVDFLAFAGTVFAVYGGVLLGVAVHWTRAGKAWQRLRPAGILKAGVWGSLAAGVVFLVGAGIHGLTTRGSFEQGIGNLWGLVLLFALLFGALVSGGVALLFRGLQRRRGVQQ